MTATPTRGPGKAPGAGLWKVDGAGTAQAHILQRQVIVDELVQHRDVWDYLGRHALAVADECPEASDERDVLWRLAACCAEIEALLGRAAAPAPAEAAS